MAAGNSSRLGQNKQLLKYKGETLIKRCIDICRKAKNNQIILILGHEYEKMLDQIHTKDLTLLLNPEWENGLSSSIAVGILWAKAKKLKGVYIVLPDQIHLESDLLISLQKTVYENPNQLICSRYKESYGPPSYFPARFFDEILNTAKGNGAKAMLDRYKAERIFIDFPLGMLDVDTPDDLKLLTS